MAIEETLLEKNKHLFAKPCSIFFPFLFFQGNFLRLKLDAHFYLYVFFNVYAKIVSFLPILLFWGGQ